MAAVLYGTGKPQWRNPPTIEVDYPRGGQFVVHIGESSHGVLAIDLDGREVLRDDRFDTDRQAHRVDVSLDVPAGRHTIRLRNEGADWLRVSRILLTDYRDPTVTPDLAVDGLQVGASYGLWLHHRLNEWSYAALGFMPRPVEDATLSLAMAEGDCQIDWTDPHGGRTWRSQATSEGGRLTLPLPSIATDLALIIQQ
jgi:hypothetical protein